MKQLMWKHKKLNKDLKHRSFPVGEGDGGWGQKLNSDKKVQECDATKAK